MKRIISILLVAIMAVSMIASAVPVFAEYEQNIVGDVKFSLTNATVMQNEQVEIKLNIDENPGLYSFWFILYYDQDALILRDMKVNDTLSELGEIYNTKDAIESKEFKGPSAERANELFKKYNISMKDKYFKVLYFESESITENVEFTGTVATFTFEAYGLAKDGDYTVGLVPDVYNFINVDNGDLRPVWSNATVHIGEGKAPTEKNEYVTPEDTVDPSKVTEEPEEPDINDFTDDTEKESAENTETKKPVETVVDDKGNVFKIDENGETVPYEPEEEETTAADNKTTDKTKEDKEPEETKAADVPGENKDKEKASSISLFGTEIPLVYFILAIILILLVIGAVLFIFINKAKNDDIDEAAAEKIAEKKAEIEEKLKDENDQTEQKTDNSDDDVNDDKE